MDKLEYVETLRNPMNLFYCNRREQHFLFMGREGEREGEKELRVLSHARDNDLPLYSHRRC